MSMKVHFTDEIFLFLERSHVTHTHTENIMTDTGCCGVSTRISLKNSLPDRVEAEVRDIGIRIGVTSGEGGSRTITKAYRAAFVRQ